MSKKWHLYGCYTNRTMADVTKRDVERKLGLKAKISRSKKKTLFCVDFQKCGEE